ncbi:MAG: hypothetical protein ACD_75C00345G0002 [uncultured bacterium]|nr:MAG: hypothetical protein ACD_75C00345G0002 [uncultured bacterium]
MGFPGIQFGGGNDALGVDGFIPFIFGLGEIIGGTRPLDSDPVVFRLDPGENVAFFDLLPLPDHDFLNRPVQFREQGQTGPGLDTAGQIDSIVNGPGLQGEGHRVDRRALLLQAIFLHRCN